MKITVSAAMSIDGYIDDRSSERLILSSPEDWAEVHRLRALCNAILVGAETLRADNPSLLAKNSERNPLRVTISRWGDLDLSSKFFTGPGRPLVFLEQSATEEVVDRLKEVADIITADKITPQFIISSLASRGISSLMVEGGQQVLTMFLAAGAFDELRLAVAPFFVGDAFAPRLVGKGSFLFDKSRRMTLQRVEKLGDVAVMHYINPDRDFLRQAIEESRKCTPSDTSYCVGAVIVTSAGNTYKGYTHQTAPSNHAEEEAILKAVNAGETLSGATIYSSMEPCSKRSSKMQSCSELIIKRGFSRVVYALDEPPCFVDCDGREMLLRAGVQVEIIPDMGVDVLSINRHITDKCL